MTVTTSPWSLSLVERPARADGLFQPIRSKQNRLLIRHSLQCETKPHASEATLKKADDAREMLGKVAHWLAARHEAKRSASDVSIQQRYNALVRTTRKKLVTNGIGPSSC